MRKNLKTILFGIYAGLAIALGGLLNITAKTLINHTGIATLIGAFLFPVGLTLVCFLGLNLFTGKIGYLFDNKKEYIGFLGLVYLGNIIGSLIAGFIALAIFRNVPEVYSVALSIAEKKASLFNNAQNIIKLFAGSILCGALVYLAVFFYKTFKNVFTKVVGIFVPIALFVYLGFDHCIANMFYFTFGFSFSNIFSYLNIVVATIGNSIGAILLNWLFKLAKKSGN